MTVDSARDSLVRAAREVWERFGELTLTALEDAPEDLDLAAEAFCEGVVQTQGIAHDLWSATSSLLTATVWPPRQLADAAAAIALLRRTFTHDLRLTLRPRVSVPAARRADGRYVGWLSAVDVTITYCEESLRAVESAQLACWRELVDAFAPRPLHMTPSSTRASGVAHTPSTEEASA